MDSKLRILVIVTVNEVHCPVKSSRIPGSNRLDIYIFLDICSVILYLSEHYFYRLIDSHTL